VRRRCRVLRAARRTAPTLLRACCPTPGGGPSCRRAGLRAESFSWRSARAHLEVVEEALRETAAVDAPWPVCDAADWFDPSFQRVVCDELRERPRFHRKQEFAFVFLAWSAWAAAPSCEGLALGGGRERLLTRWRRACGACW
jgi:hypothetical protein